jgi:pimeloyl-ACP methyl ester carboxylesterase
VSEVVHVGRRPHTLVADDGVIWVSNFDDGTISRIDPSTDPPSVTTSVAGIRPGSLEAGFGSLWVSLHQEAAVLRVGARAILPPAPEADVVEYVDTPGGEVYIRCSGTPVVRRPTVVLEADHGRGAGSWAAVEPELSSRGRVCATDRALVGRAAETAVAGRSARELASDLRIALQHVGEVGPYVVVGHGWGALPAQMFAHDFPGEVVGLVLVTPLPPTWFDEVRPLLSAEGAAGMDAALRDDPELSGTAKSIRQLAGWSSRRSPAHGRRRRPRFVSHIIRRSRTRPSASRAPRSPGAGAGSQLVTG